jgi:hypothetical protein
LINHGSGRELRLGLLGQVLSRSLGVSPPAGLRKPPSGPCLRTKATMTKANTKKKKIAQTNVRKPLGC